MFIQFPEEIKRSYSKLLQSNPSTSPWVLYSLATKTNALVVSEEGSGIDPLLEEFEASKIQFGVACHSIHNLSKYVLICWVCHHGPAIVVVCDCSSAIQPLNSVVKEFPYQERVSFTRLSRMSHLFSRYANDLLAPIQIPITESNG